MLEMQSYSTFVSEWGQALGGGEKVKDAQI